MTRDLEFGAYERIFPRVFSLWDPDIAILPTDGELAKATGACIEGGLIHLRSGCGLCVVRRFERMCECGVFSFCWKHDSIPSPFLAFLYVGFCVCFLVSVGWVACNRSGLVMGPTAAYILVNHPKTETLAWSWAMNYSGEIGSTRWRFREQRVKPNKTVNSIPCKWRCIPALVTSLKLIPLNMFPDDQYLAKELGACYDVAIVLKIASTLC